MYDIAYILLTKCEGLTGRILAWGLYCTDQVQQVPYKKEWGLIFSQYGVEHAWLIRDLLHNWNFPKVSKLRTVPNLILREYWTGSGAIWLVDFSYWSSELITAPFNNMRTLKFKAQPTNMCFSLPSIKCSAAPPSFQLCCLNCVQRFDLITTRSAVVGS